MPDLREQNRLISAACSNGDVSTLETLFLELNIGPDQPQNSWNFDKEVPEEERTLPVQSMLHAAVRAKQLETVRFLFSRFPKSSGPIGAAIDTGDAELVRVVCELDPGAANGEVGHSNVLGHACSSGGADATTIIKVLLKHGADPNRGAAYFPWPDICHAISAGLPVSTIHDFCDAGYAFRDRWTLGFAVQHGRPDVFEVLVARGKELPNAWWPPKEELLKEAKEKDDREMIATIERVYPRRKKGLVAAMMDKWRS